MNTKQPLNNPFANAHPPQQQQFSGQQPQAQYQQPTQQYQQPIQPQQTQQPDKKKKKGKKKYLLLLLLLLLIPTVMFFKGFIGGVDLPAIPGINWDKNQGVGDLTGKSKAEIEESLNDAAQGYRVRMNSNPIFKTGTSKGTFRIVNSDSNLHPQLIEIYTKDDNTLLYSGAVAVGNNIDESELLVDLPKGEYDCLAYISPINPETGKKLTTGKADIKITILN